MVFVGAPSAINTAMALRQAIWRKTNPAWAMCGIPDILHVDHGSDFVSHHLDRTAIALHIRIILSIVGRSQAKGRSSGSSEPSTSNFWPRSPATSDRAAEHQRRSWTWPASTARSANSSTYNDRIYSELAISPRDAWVADGWLPRMPASLQELDGLLLTVPKNRVVQRDGIHFQGQRYLAPTLAPFIGHTITIRYNPRDIETARRARRKQLQQAINDRIPTMATREEPRTPEPIKRRPRLRTY